MTVGAMLLAMVVFWLIVVQTPGSTRGDDADGSTLAEVVERWADDHQIELRHPVRTIAAGRSAW